MIRKSTNTRAPLNQIQELTSKGLASLMDRAGVLLRPSDCELQTIFTGRSKKQIVNLIDLDDDGGSTRSWGDLSRNLIVLLTDLFFFYERQGEVVITPSLYLQYFNLKSIEGVAETKTANKELQSIVLRFRGFIYDMTQKATDESSESDKMTVSDVFYLISSSTIMRLKFLEAIRVPNKIPNRFSVQKNGNLRIANADYSHTRLFNSHAIPLSDDGLYLVYRHLRKSTFLGAVGSVDAQYAVFEDCILDKANLNHSLFEWTTFINTSIDKTVFADSRFFDVDFKGLNNSESAVFVNCRFCLCEMVGCKALFIDCDFDDCENEGVRIINNNNKQTNEQEGATKMLKKRTYIDDVNAAFASESAGVIIEMLSSYVEGNSKGDDEMLIGRVTAFISAITRPLVYLRDKGHIQLSPTIYSKYMAFNEVEELAFKHDGKYGTEFDEVTSPLKAYIKTVPGYDTSRIDEGQTKQTNEQFGFIAMNVIKILNSFEVPKQQTPEQTGFTNMQDAKID